VREGRRARSARCGVHGSRSEGSRFEVRGPRFEVREGRGAKGEERQVPTGGRSLKPEVGARILEPEVRSLRPGAWTCGGAKSPQAIAGAKVGGGAGSCTRVRNHIPAGIYDAYPLLMCRSRREEAARTAGSQPRKISPTPSGTTGVSQPA
jgi:hypothetical protein